MGAPPDSNLDTPQQDAADAVPVAILPNAISAHIIKSVLEAADIRAVVAGEHVSSLLPHWGAIVPVNVLVPRNDYDRAIAAINQSLLDTGAPSRCSLCGYDLGGLEQQDRCPECGGKYEDLRRRITLAPRPPAANNPIARIGAFMGVLVIVGIIAAIVSVVIWGLRP